jgi:hypothetical protein
LFVCLFVIVLLLLHTGSVAVAPGEKYLLLVGQRGESTSAVGGGKQLDVGLDGKANTQACCFVGGGGTFFAQGTLANLAAAQPVIVAGGGGGGAANGDGVGAVAGLDGTADSLVT